MTVTPSSFKIRFPEFDSETDSRIQLFIDDAVCEVNEIVWDIKTDLGVSYLAAHFLSVANETTLGGGSSGPITARSVDGTSASYGSTTTDNLSDAYFSKTSYGQRYVQLRSLLVGAGYIV